MATSTIQQNHASAITVTSVGPNSTLTVTLSGGTGRGIILVGGATSGHFPFVCGFRFSDAGTTFVHQESPSGSSAITIAKGSSSNTIVITSTSSVTTPIVIFMENRYILSLVSAASS